MENIATINELKRLRRQAQGSVNYWKRNIDYIKNLITHTDDDHRHHKTTLNNRLIHYQERYNHAKEQLQNLDAQISAIDPKHNSPQHKLQRLYENASHTKRHFEQYLINAQKQNNNEPQRTFWTKRAEETREKLSQLQQRIEELRHELKSSPSASDRRPG